jgi:hypothetical protein
MLTFLGDSDQFDNFADHLVGTYSFGISLIAQDDTMAQGVMHDSPDIIGCDMISSVKPGMDSRAFIQS